MEAGRLSFSHDDSKYELSPPRSRATNEWCTPGRDQLDAADDLCDITNCRHDSESTIMKLDSVGDEWRA